MPPSYHAKYRVPLENPPEWAQFYIVISERRRFSFNFPISIFHFSKFFLAPMSIHPKEKPPPQPPPLGSSPWWPHSGRVKMGSCLLPLVTFLDLRIFALIRKLRGENPKKASGWGNFKTNGATLPSLSLHPNHLHLPPLSSLYLPCTSPLVPMMVWWWGMTPLCPF